MKETLITILRDRQTSIAEFRQASDLLTTTLAGECGAVLPKITSTINTPLAKTEGKSFKRDPVLVPILRSGVVMLQPFLHFFPQAKVGFVGTQRDEVTTIAALYYKKLPALDSETPIFLLDPTIATGKSASLAIDILKNAGCYEKNITLISFFAAPQGVEQIQKMCPHVRIIVAQVDKSLDAKRRIMPGLGDFGDRYFGTMDE